MRHTDAVRRAPQNVTLVASELRIRRELRGASASPFVAHAYLDSKKRELMAAALMEFVGRTADGIDPRALDLDPEHRPLGSSPPHCSTIMASTITGLNDPVAAAFGGELRTECHSRAALNLGLQESLRKARPDHGWRQRHRARRRSASFKQALARKVELRALIEASTRAEAVIGCSLLTTIRSDFMHGQVCAAELCSTRTSSGCARSRAGTKVPTTAGASCTSQPRVAFAARPLKARSRKLSLHDTNRENNFRSSAPERTCRGRSSSRTEMVICCPCSNGQILGAIR